MTRGSKGLGPDASIYDRAPIVLFERFPWAERTKVLGLIRAILATGDPNWSHGGAYLYWAQGREEDSGGELLYAGEAEDLTRRHTSHLLGGPATGHKFTELDAYFAEHPNMICGLALLVVRPIALEWLYPPDQPPILADDALKRAGEELEGLILRASKSRFRAMPRFNDREDASKFRHRDDVVRFESLARFLLDFRDVTMDFVTFRMRDELKEASTKLAAEVEAYREILSQR
jgi:hypothetical protein